jgi:YNFM family putative membrane transporter
MGAFVTIYNYAGFRLLAPPYRLNQTQIGLIFLSYVFGMFASSAAGTLADRLGRTSVVVAGSLVTMSGLALTLLHPLTSVIAGIVAITVGFFMVHSVASGWVGRLASRNKSHAASLYLLSYYFGSSILGSLGGWFWREGGWAAVVAFCSTLMMIVLGIAAKLRRGSDLSES